MTQQQVIANASRLMHEVHLAYQRQMLRRDATTLPCSEVRGCHEERRPLGQWKPEWSSHLRPNFWSAYFETLTFMSK